MPVARPETWAVLQHADFEDPGVIVQVASERGLPVHLLRVDRGDSLPNPAAIAGLVVMGGPMGVYEADRYPFLKQEMALLAETVARGVPTLGVCLGSQLLAAALGAEVIKGPVREIGASSVRLTPEGAEDPLLGPEGATLPVVQWHQDTFALPRGVTHLASSELYRNQAFRAGRCAYALQFHLELDRRAADLWRAEFPAGVTLSEADQQQVEAVGRRVFNRFFDLAGQQEAAAD